MERELYIARDNGQPSTKLGLFTTFPDYKYGVYLSDIWYYLDSSLFPEIKPGECKRVKITIEFIEE